MRIEQQLAVAITRAALFEPYRQITLMPSDKFQRWLRARGLGVGRWETLHHLWTVGVLHPIAVRNTDDFGNPIPIDTSDGRLVEAGEGWDGRVYADLGVDVPDDTPLAPPPGFPPGLRHCLLWHPFQLWYFDRLDLSLQVRYQWDLRLSGPHQGRESLDKLWRRDLSHVIEFSEADWHLSFLHLMRLLLAVEPLVHPW